MNIPKTRHTFTEKGFAHIILPLLVFIVVGGIGAYVVFAHAQTPIATSANTVSFKSAFAGKCLDEWHDGTTEGTAVDIYGCNNSVAQEWTLKTEKVGDLIENVNGKTCIDNWQAADTSNNPIKVYDCNPYDTAQLWYVRGNTLQNTQTGMCITDPDGNTTDGTDLRLDPCTSAKDQQWTPTPVTTTTPPTTTVAPTINAVGSSDPSTTGVTITWTTNQSSTSEVQYGTTASYGSTTTGTSSVTAHSVTLSGLNADKTYHYRVVSANSAGKTTTSGDYTFTTAKTATGGGGTGTTGGSGTAFAGCAQTYTNPGTGQANNANVALGNGDEHLQADEWSSNSTFSICGNSSDQFQVTKSSISNENQYGATGAPGAYPSLIVGCHWTTTFCTSNNPLPIQVSAMTSGKVTTSYNTTTINSGGWDDSYDIWFNANAHTATNNGADSLEMMVWLDHAGGAGPAGGNNQVGTISINGTTFDIFWNNDGNNSGTITYEATKPLNSISNLDLGMLADNAMKYTPMKSSWYLIDVEAGFEVWYGGVGLTANSLSVDVK